MKNRDLKNFYQKVYVKGEEKHYTDFVTKSKISSEPFPLIITLILCLDISLNMSH
jgi:hypothetical protein